MVKAKTKVARMMRKLDLTGNELARRLGVSPQMASHYKRNGLHISSVCRKFAKALRCRPADLLEECDQ